MPRIAGEYRITGSSEAGGEIIRAFVPRPLPPQDPPLAIAGDAATTLEAAMGALSRLALAADLVPSAHWFLYSFVRKEALLTSQIEGTQATLEDVLSFEAGEQPQRPDDVHEVCNYLDALDYARTQIANPHGLPVSARLLCEAHSRLMRGTRGADKQPGQIRRTQNWIGGTRPGNARFVPPPPELVPEALSSLEKWIHAPDPLPPLVRAGLAHVQFETIHPFLDGNGRIGRLLIALLVEHWSLLPAPALYLSVAFKRHQQEYYQRLDAVRTTGDWEGWIRFFLACVTEAANDGVTTAQRLFSLVNDDRQAFAANSKATVPAIRLLERLPRHPVVTLSLATRLLEVSKPTAIKALDALVEAGVLQEVTGKKRDRVYAYARYLKVLAEDT